MFGDQIESDPSALGELNEQDRSSRYQSWMKGFENNVCTCFTRSAKPAGCCQPRTPCSKNQHLSAKFTVMADSRTSAKESTWDVAWPSNTSGSGQRTGSTRFSRYSSHTPLNSLPLLTLHVGVLPGNYRLETPFSPQHLTIVGSFCLHGSPEFPHRLRLDAKWERNGVHQVQSRGEPSALGEPTRSLLADRALRISDAPQLSGVMSGAAYLHGLGVVHGDLKGVQLNILNPFFFFVSPAS